MVNLTIDGKQITTAKTATIYEAAKENGIYIPVLCYAKKLLPYGACRICLVEVEQMKGRLIPSCTTPLSSETSWPRSSQRDTTRSDLRH